MLTSVVAGGNDVTDTTLDLKGHETFDDLDITVTDRTASLTGTATDSAGRALSGGAVIVFAERAAEWSYPSRFVRMAPVGARGAFTVRGLLPGRYLVAPLNSLPANWDAPESLERLRALAMPLTLTAGERRTIAAPVKVPR